MKPLSQGAWEGFNLPEPIVYGTEYYYQHGTMEPRSVRQSVFSCDVPTKREMQEESIKIGENMIDEAIINLKEILQRNEAIERQEEKKKMWIYQKGPIINHTFAFSPDVITILRDFHEDID